MKESNKKTFVFLPETGMYPYFRTLVTAAECVSKGSDILCLSCTGQMETCTMLACSNKLQNCTIDEKIDCCKQCKKLNCDALQNYGFTNVELNDFLTETKLSELQSLVPQNIEDCYSYKYMGFEVGQIAIYDLVLATKILDIYKLSDEFQKLYKRYLLNTIIALEISEYVINKFKPDLVLAFNPYSECQAAKFIAQKHGINFEFLTAASHMGADYSKYYFSKNFIDIEISKTCQKWSEYSKYPVTRNCVKLSFDDAIFRSFGTGSHIFSNSKGTNPAQLLESLGLQKNKKTLVAFTSSNDEFLGANFSYKVWNIIDKRKDVFKNTLKWLKYLKLYSEKHLDIQIIVRVHPREGKRQGCKPSEHLQLLQKEFKANTENFVIVWSDDPISSYDLMELADGVLVTLSTMAQESARVGIPILSTVFGKYYSNASFMHVAKTIEEYEDKLNNLLNVSYSYEMLRDAIRYNYWRNFIQSMDFSDTIPHDFNNPKIWPHISKEKAEQVYKVCINEENLIDLNVNAWKTQVSEKTEIEEKQAIGEGIARYINRIMIPRKELGKVSVFILRIINKILRLVSFRKLNINLISLFNDKIKQPNPILTIGDKKKNINHSRIQFGKRNEIIFSYKKHCETRYSPQLYRLAKIYQDIFDK